MAKLLRTPQASKLSKAEESGNAFRQLKHKGNLSIPGAARLWQLHKYTVTDYVNNGFIRFIQIGQRRVIPEDECNRIAGLLRVHGSLAAAKAALEQEGINHA